MLIETTKTNKDMENNTNNQNNTIMDYNNCIWVNHYDRHGELSTSTPYSNFADAITSVEEMLNLVNPRFSEDRQFERKSAFVWENKKGMAIRIETKGDLFMHIADTWVAVSANYDCDPDTLNDMTHNKAFLLRLFGLTLLDNKRMFAFADEIWGKSVGN